MPNVLSPKDLVFFRPDSMDETVPHTLIQLNTSVLTSDFGENRVFYLK